jgi:hypothetical protein
MKLKTYQIYGAAILLLFLYLQYTGWAWTDQDEVPNVPRSVRDNPGSYRSHYHHHYSGGK